MLNDIVQTYHNSNPLKQAWSAHRRYRDTIAYGATKEAAEESLKRIESAASCGDAQNQEELKS